MYLHITLLKSTIFRTITDESTGAVRSIGLFGRSITDLKTSLASIKANGFFNTIFNTSTIDVSKVTAYNAAIANGTNAQEALAQASVGTNKATINLIKSANGATVSTEALTAAQKASTVASKALSIGMKALSVAMNVGIALLIPVIINGIDKLITTKAELAEKAEEVTSKFREQKEELTGNRAKFDELAVKYEKLSKGVNALGENLSLTSDEYEEYHNVVNQIASMFPSWVKGWDEQGNAILDVKGNVEELTQAYNDAIIAANNVILKDAKTVFGDFKNDMEENDESNFKGNEFTTYSYKALKNIINSNDLDSAIQQYAATGTTNMVQIVQALKDAGLEQNWNESGHDFIKRACQENSEIVRSIVGDFEQKLETETAGVKSVAEAYIGNAFLGDYAKVDKSIQGIVKQIVSGFDAEFYSQFDSVDELYKYLKGMLDDFANLNKEDTANIKTFFEIQTKFNNGEITVAEYQEKLSSFLSAIDGLPEETQKAIKLLFGITTNDDGTTSSDVDTMVKNVKDKFKGKFDKEIGQLKLDELEILADLDISPEGIESWSEVETLIANAGKEANKMTVSMMETGIDEKIKEYNELTDQINKCTDAKERENLISKQNNLKNEIADLEDAIRSYKSLKTAYENWQAAKETQNEGSEYDTIFGELEDIKKMRQSGLIGTDDFKAFTRLISDQDIAGMSSGDIAKAFDKSFPKIQRYFTEGSQGLQRFLQDVSKLNTETEKFAEQNADGSWNINFDGEKIAKELGVSEAAVEAMAQKLQDYGFDINTSPAESSLSELKDAFVVCNDKLKELKEQGKITIDVPEFNMNSTDENDLNSQIEKAKELFNSFKNEDGTFNVGVEGFEEARTILATLIKQKQNVSEPALVKLTFDRETATNEVETAAALINEFRTKYQDLEVRLATGEDTSELQAEIQGIVGEINKIPEDTKIALGINSDEFNTAIKTISETKIDVPAGINIPQTELDNINTTLRGVTAEVMVKAGVDSTKVEGFKSAEHETEGTVKWDNDTKKVDKFKKEDHKAKGEIEWKNKYTPPQTPPKTTGESNAQGTAFSQGNWGTKHSGKALGGELGQELVVRNGRYFTIGDNGAEFFDYQKGDIIFNAEQTKQIFKNGKISYGRRRGLALAEGNAFSGGNTYSGGGSFTTTTTTTTTTITTSKNKSTSSSSKDSPDYEDPTDAIINRINLRSKELEQQEESIQNAIEIAELENDYKKQISLTNDLIAKRKDRVKELNTANAWLHNEAEWQRKNNLFYDKDGNLVDTNTWFNSLGEETEAYKAFYNSQSSKEEQERIKNFFEMISKYKEAYAKNAEEISDINKENLQDEENNWDTRRQIFDDRLEESEYYIEHSNDFGWENGDNEIKARKRVLDWIQSDYYKSLIKDDVEYYKILEENRLKYNEALEEEFNKATDFASSCYDSQKTLLQSHYDVTNSISEAQHELNKELAASKTMYEYLDEETRKLLFNQEDYNKLSARLVGIQAEANWLQDQYTNDLQNSTIENLEEITSQYEMQYETLMKSYEIAKAELEVAKKRQQLDNVLNERNVRMLINGQWQWVAKTQDVINAQSELADAKYAMETAKAGLRQTESIHDLTAKQDHLGTVISEFENGVIDLDSAIYEVTRMFRELPTAMQNSISQIDPSFTYSSGRSSGYAELNGAKFYGIPDDLLPIGAVKHHATGTKKTSKGLATINEILPEGLITNNGTLIPMANFAGGEMVFNHEMMENLWHQAQIPWSIPSVSIPDFVTRAPSSGQSIVYDIHDFEVNPTDVDSFVQDLTARARSYNAITSKMK